MSLGTGKERTVTTLNHPPPEDPLDAPPDAEPRGIAPWRKLAVGAFVVLLGAGVVWQLTSDDGGPGVTTPTSVTSTATSSVPPDPSRPPELRNTGEDFDAIVRSARDFENWVFQFDPDPKWVPQYLDPVHGADDSDFQQATQKLAALQAQGHHYDAPGLVVRKVIVRDRTSEVQAGVYVVYESRPANIVDRDGNVVAAQPTLPPTGYFEDWVRGEDGRWRLAQSTVLGPPAPELLR